MAPLKPVNKDNVDKRVQTVLELAKRISNVLKDRSEISSTILEETRLAINRSFPLPSTATHTGKLSECDSLGCELWNAATNFTRLDERQRDPRIRNGDHTQAVVHLRVFAFLLIDAPYSSLSKRSKDRNRDQLTRNFKTGLKACRFCLDKGELELALRVLERCSDHVSVAEEDSPLVHMSDSTEDDEHRTSLRALMVEFYLLRMTHSWKSDRLDLAEHFFNKIQVSDLAQMASVAEKAADLFYEMGRSLSKKDDNQLAVKWLERAITALDACDLDHSSQDLGEIRLTIVSTFVECLLRSGGAESIERSQELIEQLYTTHGLGNRLAVQLMHIKILLKDNPVRTEQLNDALLRVIRSAVLTDKTFKTIMQAIHRVRKVSLEVACGALEELLTTRFLDDPRVNEATRSSDQVYVEKTCITYVMFATSDLKSSNRTTIDGLQKTLDMIAQRIPGGLSAKATHAAQTLIWKATVGEDTAEMERYCDLLRHTLFDSAGQSNKARIDRKAISTAMVRNDLNAARKIFFQMTTAVQNESMTRYLAFKLALRTKDYDFAKESLDIITKHASQDHTVLYACVLEAQQSEMRTIAVATLQAILDKQPATVHLPALLRCTARLLVGELSTNDRTMDEVMVEIVVVFERAAQNLQALRSGTNEQWRAEFQWWSKNAYNLGLQHCVNMDLEHLVRLLSVCTKFIDAYPDDTGVMHQDDLRHRKALCHFLSSCALIALGRSSESKSEYSLECYRRARREIEGFRSLHRHDHDKDQHNLSGKAFELLKFDLECILNLEQWKELDTVLQACLDFRQVDRWDTLADIVLVIRQQMGVSGLNESTNNHMNQVLENIINDTWQNDKDLGKASRWLRLSFTMDLKEGTSEFALHLLKDAAKMAKKGASKGSNAYPETELQWLASTSFNKAVDLLSNAVMDASKEWFRGALDLAKYGADNGALHANLMGKYEQAMERLQGAA